MKSISDIISKKNLTSDYRNKHEFQAYGNRLAEELNDTRNRALYIKLSKNEDRNLLEAARLYAVGAEKIDLKGRLFMWKLKQLRDSGGKSTAQSHTDNLKDANS